MNTTIIVVIAVYLVFMVAVGAFFSGKSKNSSDYFLGGRKLGPLVTAMSAEASDMSSWLLMGLPGVALAAGLAEATWTAIGLGIGTYLCWLFVAKKLRIYSQKINAVTIPEFFSKRFGDKKGILSLVSAVVIVVFFVPYTASGFNACGTLFNSLSGGRIDYLSAMIISAVVIVLYTALGGFLAASTTDLIQSVVMTIALVAVVLFGIQYAGGWNVVAENAKNIPDYLKLTTTFSESGTVQYSGLTIASTLAWGLGYFGMPHILLRFMAIENPEKVKTSRRIGTIWVLIAMGVAILIGVIGRGIVDKTSLINIGYADGQRIIVEISKLISEQAPILAVLAGIILAGVLASTMSTADSQLLAASSSISQDLLSGVFKVKMSDRAQLLVSRLTILAISVIAAYMARKEQSVFKIVSFAWAGFGAAFGPVILCGLFWKRTTKAGAIAGMLAGGGMTFLWKYVIAKIGGVFAIYELLPAFVFGLAVIIIVSLLTKTDASVVEVFDEISKGNTDSVEEIHIQE